MTTFFNGKYISSEMPCVPINDRGFLLGDGVFETMRSYRGHVPFLADHWERLKSSARVLSMPVPITFLDLQDIVHNLLNLNELTVCDATLRLTITRGVGPRGVVPPTEPNPTVVLTAAKYTASSPLQAVSLFVTSIVKNEYSPLSRIKSLCYLENVLARMEAIKNAAQEGILLNTKGYVAETTAANIFMINEAGEVCTPRIEDGAMPGITRKVILTICKELGIIAKEIAISLVMLQQAQSIFITNSVIAIQIVHAVNGIAINNKENSTIERIQNAYTEKVHNIKKSRL